MVRAPKSPLTKSSAVGAIPTPTYPKNNGNFTILCTTTISAPLATVVDASLETSTWPAWNTFVPETKMISQEATRIQTGTQVAFYSRMKPGGPLNTQYVDHEVVSVEDIEREGCKGVSIVWKSFGAPGADYVLRVERVQELLETKQADGTVQTEYKTWGTFGGPASYLLSWTGVKKDLVDRFEDWANDLKAYAEAQQKH